MISNKGKIFEYFHKRAQKIKKHKFLSAYLSIRTEVKINKPVKSFLNLPDENSLRSFASLIRPYYQNDDIINFTRVCNIISNPTNNFSENLRRQSFKVKSAWNKLLQTKKIDLSPSGVVLKYNDEEITTPKLLDLYFNGDFFHTDLTKAEKLESMQLPLFKEPLLMNLADTLQKMGKLIIWLDKNVIDKVLNQR